MRALGAVGVSVLLMAGACSSGDGSSELSSDTTAAPISTSASVADAGTAETITTTPAPVASGPTTTRAGSTAARPAAPTTTTARSATTTTRPTTATTAPPAGPTAAITIQNFTFSPPVLNVAAGTTVTATNRDGAPHSWTADNGTWDSGTLNQNEAFSYRFATPGTFPYHCAIHPSMKATVNVA